MKTIVDIYFPNGKCSAQNFDKEDLIYFVATFQEERVPDFDGNFTVEKYIAKKSTPVRLYLHTKIKQVSIV